MGLVDLTLSVPMVEDGKRQVTPEDLPLGSTQGEYTAVVYLDDIEERTVWLAADARQWICEQGISLFVSDIYESLEAEGVFIDLFRAGIATVCHPVNLHKLTAPYVRLTALPARLEGVTQLPCRVVAEMEA